MSATEMILFAKYHYNTCSWQVRFSMPFTFANKWRYSQYGCEMTIVLLVMIFLKVRRVMSVSK